MKSGLLFAVMLLSCTGALQARAAAPGGASDKPSEAIIEGCLGKSALQYTLTDATGTMQRVTGKNLKNYLGHHVQLTGVATTTTTSTTQVGGASSVVMQPLFRVSSVKDISKDCSAEAEK